MVRIVTTIVLSLCLTSGAQSVMAWQSFVHQGLTKATDFSKLDPRVAQYQVAMIDGSDEPDRRKSIWRAFSHARDARTRSLNAFEAAVKEYRQGNYEMAARRLGHSFHYLQDIGDISKLHGRFKSETRGKAEAAFKNTFTTPGKIQRACAFVRHKKGLTAFGSCTTVANAIDRLKSGRSDRAKKILAHLKESKRSGKSFKEAFGSVMEGILELQATLCETIDCQNKMIALFNQETQK